MAMRSKALLDLRDCYGQLVAARMLAETSPGEDAQSKLRIAQDDFSAAAEELARLVPRLVPPVHQKTFGP